MRRLEKEEEEGGGVYTIYLPSEIMFEQMVQRMSLSHWLSGTSSDQKTGFSSHFVSFMVQVLGAKPSIAPSTPDDDTVDHSNKRKAALYMVSSETNSLYLNSNLVLTQNKVLICFCCRSLMHQVQ